MQGVAERARKYYLLFYIDCRTFWYAPQQKQFVPLRLCIKVRWHSWLSVKVRLESLYVWVRFCAKTLIAWGECG